jgi:hypothetical protein
MIGVIYEKTTGKIRQMIVPENKKEEGLLNGGGFCNLNPDEAFLLLGDDITGLVPDMNKVQEEVNKIIKDQ